MNRLNEDWKHGVGPRPEVGNWVRCSCSCHRNAGVKHVVACCENGWIEEIILPAPPSSPTATAEEILKKHFDEDWPEDMGVRGTAEEWEAFKENQPVFIKSMIEAMTEYASLKEQEARSIIYDDSFSAQEKISELKKVIK